MLYSQFLPKCVLFPHISSVTGAFLVWFAISTISGATDTASFLSLPQQGLGQFVSRLGQIGADAQFAARHPQSTVAGGVDACIGGVQLGVKVKSIACSHNYVWTGDLLVLIATVCWNHFGPCN